MCAAPRRGSAARHGGAPRDGYTNTLGLAASRPGGERPGEPGTKSAAMPRGASVLAPHEPLDDYSRSFHEAASRRNGGLIVAPGLAAVLGVRISVTAEQVFPRLDGRESSRSLGGAALRKAFHDAVEVQLCDASRARQIYQNCAA